MVVQASPQVTAAQVLDAGRRAEADGRLDYAVQFYRHLTDHHSGAPEAAAARDALSRLSRRAGAGLQQRTTVRSRAAEPPPIRKPSNRSAAERAEAEQKISRGPIQIAPIGTAQSAPALELPEPEDFYRLGRTIAHGFTGLGILLLMAGLLILAVVALPAELTTAVTDRLPAIHVLTGPITAVTGIVLMLFAQLARAVFDMAAANRDLAAIERAKAETANAPLQ